MIEVYKITSVLVLKIKTYSSSLSLLFDNIQVKIRYRLTIIDIK